MEKESHRVYGQEETEEEGGVWRKRAIESMDKRRQRRKGGGYGEREP